MDRRVRHRERRLILCGLRAGERRARGVGLRLRRIESFLRLIEIRLGQARRRVEPFRALVVGVRLLEHRVELRHLRLGLLNLRARLVEPFVVVGRPDAAELRALGDAIARLHTAHLSVRAAQLIHAVDDARRLEGEVDLPERLDRDGVAFGDVRGDLLDCADAHGLNGFLERFRAAAASRGDGRDREREVSKAQRGRHLSSPIARSNAALACQNPASAC